MNKPKKTGSQPRFKRIPKDNLKDWFEFRFFNHDHSPPQCLSLDRLISDCTYDTSFTQKQITDMAELLVSKKVLSKINGLYMLREKQEQVTGIPLEENEEEVVVNKTEHVKLEEPAESSVGKTKSKSKSKSSNTKDSGTDQLNLFGE